MTSGKTIKIFLADGTATGIRHAEVVNWTGQAVVCPRGRVGELSAWPESLRPGVYVLYGDDSSGTKPSAYIGEAENVHTRLQEHVKKKDFWDQVVLFTSKDENLTKAHVKYLEAKMVELASNAGRVVLENGNVPNFPTLPRADRAAMEDFVEPARLLLAALGFFILQPVPQKVALGSALDAGRGPLSGTRLFFKVTATGVDAEGASTDDGFVVYAGSKGSSTVLDSLPSGWLSIREELITHHSIGVEGDDIVFTEDVLFKSPSAAAAIVCGGNRNGREAWRDVDGRTLKSLEEELSGGDAEEE